MVKYHIFCSSFEDLTPDFIKTGFDIPFTFVCLGEIPQNCSDSILSSMDISFLEKISKKFWSLLVIISTTFSFFKNSLFLFRLCFKTSFIGILNFPALWPQEHTQVGNFLWVQGGQRDSVSLPSQARQTEYIGSDSFHSVTPSCVRPVVHLSVWLTQCPDIDSMEDSV